jgi:hypothetical protein
VGQLKPPYWAKSECQNHPLADKSKVEFNPNVGMKVRFIDKESGLDIGFSDLVEIYDFVADTVFPAFAGFFPQPVIPGQPK